MKRLMIDDFLEDLHELGEVFPLEKLSRDLLGLILVKLRLTDLLAFRSCSKKCKMWANLFVTGVRFPIGSHVSPLEARNHHRFLVDNFSFEMPSNSLKSVILSHEIQRFAIDPARAALLTNFEFENCNLQIDRQGSISWAAFLGQLTSLRRLRIRVDALPVSILKGLEHKSELHSLELYAASWYPRDGNVSDFCRKIRTLENLEELRLTNLEFHQHIDPYGFLCRNPLELVLPRLRVFSVDFCGTLAEASLPNYLHQLVFYMTRLEEFSLGFQTESQSSHSWIHGDYRIPEWFSSQLFLDFAQASPNMRVFPPLFLGFYYTANRDFQLQIESLWPHINFNDLAANFGLLFYR